MNGKATWFGPCPKCGMSQDDGTLYQRQLQLDWWKKRGLTPEQLYERIKAKTDPETRYTKLRRFRLGSQQEYAQCMGCWSFWGVDQISG